MSNSTNYTPVIFFGRRIYILFVAVASIPIWLAANTYVKALDMHEDEAFATAITISFIAAVFAGRYIAQIWTLRMNVLPRGMVVGLTCFIILTIGWLFFYADFPLRERKGISLLLTWLPFILMSFAIGMLIKTIRAVTEKQLNEARTSAARSESELKLLQSQLSPHFLFNTLNNMYGLSITHHEKIPPLLLKLSELLRYSVYGSNDTFVPLKHEIEYINNYIEFEKIRIGERLVLRMDIDQTINEDTRIAPMLLIVFIENAFKHSKNTADEQVFVEIGLKIWNNTILFSIINSYNKKERRNGGFDNNSGLGLENVVKRLQLLYPNEHILDIEEKDNTYSVMLQLKVKK